MDAVFNELGMYVIKLSCMVKYDGCGNADGKKKRKKKNEKAAANEDK